MDTGRARAVQQNHALENYRSPGSSKILERHGQVNIERVICHTFTNILKIYKEHTH